MRLRAVRRRLCRSLRPSLLLLPSRGGAVWGVTGPAVVAERGVREWCELGGDSGRVGRVREVAAFDDHEPRPGDQLLRRFAGAERPDGVMASPDQHGGGGNSSGLSPEVVLGEAEAAPDLGE